MVEDGSDGDDDENEDESLNDDKDIAAKGAAQVAAVRAPKRPRNRGIMKRPVSAIAAVGATTALHRSFKNRKNLREEKFGK